MADDQSTKTMDINDLVRELSKSSTSPVAPPPVPQPIKPPFPTQKPITPPQPMAGSPSVSSVPRSPIPTTPVPPKPAPSPAPISSSSVSGSSATPSPSSGPAASSSTTPGVKEYQSSIRTMSEDISNLKQGQKPAGIDVPRKVEQVAPTPQAMPPKPTIPAQQFKVPSVNLGEAQKTGPLSQSKDSAPVPPRSMPIPPKVEPKPQIYIPQEGQRDGNRNILFIGIGAIAIVAGFAYWFFMLRSPAPVVVEESPTPTPTATPVINLGSIFQDIYHVVISFENNQDGMPIVADLNTIIDRAVITGGEFQNMIDPPALDLASFLDVESVEHPPELTDLKGVEFLPLLYGQKEIFDSNGQIKTDALVGKRLVFVSEVPDVTILSQLMTTWETEMTDHLKTIFQFDSKQQANQNFTDNSYGGVGIRYKNFPFADKSIDYAIVPASNGKSYLVIASSREAMYATIDKLNGF